MMAPINGTQSPTEEFSPEEKEKINQLRERICKLLRPGLDDDRSIAKWLIARKFDVDNAEDMFKKYAQFVKTNGLEDILNTYEHPEVADYVYTAFLGYDYEGSVVRVFNVGACDIRGLSLAMSKLDSLKTASYVLQSDIKRQMIDRANDKFCDKQVYIMNLDGLDWRSAISRSVVDRSFMLLRSYEANFPERLKVAYIVNVPGFFSFIYSWLKSFLPESIISKLEVLSRDELTEKLGKTMDLSILPVSLGGTKTDPDGDPNCQSLYRKPLGEPVPERLIPTDQLEPLKNDPAAKKILVEYKSLFIAEKTVTEQYSTLEWDFQTADYDIRFSLRYKKSEDSEPIEIIPPHRVECHVFPETGKITCENTGIYELVFDNTYSWMTSKELIFKVGLQPPSNNLDY